MPATALRQVFLLLLCLLAGSALHAAKVPPISAMDRLPSAPIPSLPKMSATAVRANHVDIPRLEGEPRLNDFLSQPVASQAAKQMLRISDFTERYPNDGQPATESTIAYLGYTREYLFAAFVCRDKSPGLIRAHMLARDSLGDDDYVEVMLDTFDDRRRAFVFDSNALAIQSDGLYSEQNGADSSFDTVWDTWGKRTPSGYAVLMRIRFASLYFKKAEAGQTRTWGIILQRNISHANEQAFWPQIRHTVAGRLTQDIAAEGFRDIEHGQNYQIEPYVLGRNLRQLNTIDANNPYFQDRHLQGYTGLDAKFILHNSLILDTTVNPDFSRSASTIQLFPISDSQSAIPALLRRGPAVFYRKQQLFSDAGQPLLQQQHSQAAVRRAPYRKARSLDAGTSGSG
jgi:hypothetical protein